MEMRPGGREELIKKHAIGVALSGANWQTFMTANGRPLLRGLDEFQTLPESERKPTTLIPNSQIQGRDPGSFPFVDQDKPPAAPPDALVARTYVRGLAHRAGQWVSRGELARERLKRGYDVVAAVESSGPNRDFLWLLKSKWQSLVPPQPVVGQRYPVSEAIIDRIFRYHLWDGSRAWQSGWWRKSTDRRAGELTLEVEEVSPTDISMRLEGFGRLADHVDEAQASRRADFRFMGFLRYDRTRQAFTRFDVIALGEFFSSVQRSPYLQKGISPLGVAFELAEPGSQGHGIHPHGLRERLPEEFQLYFGKEAATTLRAYFHR